MSRGASALAASIAAFASACTPALPNGATDPWPARIDTRDAVVRVGAYAIVPAVAAASNRVFVVGEDGVAIWDRGGHRWLPPIALPSRLPGMRAPRLLAATNLIGDALWVAGAGRVVVVSPNLRATFSAFLPGEPRAIRVERSGANAYVLADEWWQVGATGDARPISPAQLPPRQQLLDATDASDPALRRVLADPLLTRDATLRSWPIIAAARSPMGTDLWLGTAGGGTFDVDPDFHRSEQLAFGLRAGSVLALARTADGIVAAEEPLAGVTGPAVVTEGSDDLERWRWDALAEQTGYVRAVALRGRSICLAGESGAGITELPPENASALPATITHTEPEPAAVAIAARDGCVVGTMRGVSVLPWPGDTTAPRTLGGLPAVYALAAAGDTIWAGTRDGVATIVGDRVVARSQPLPAAAVVALTLVPDGLAVATQGDVAIVTAAGVQRLTLSLASVGRIAALAADDHTLWIGGTSGALVVSLDTRAATPVPFAPPGSTDPEPLGGRDVRAIVLAPGIAWLGTAAGLVRLRRGSDGLPR